MNTINAASGRTQSHQTASCGNQTQPMALPVARPRGHMLRALTIATTLGLGSALMAQSANADDNRREACDGHYERHHPGYRMGKRQMAEQNPYAEAEMRTIANAMALRMLGPGSSATVTSGDQGSWQVALIDAKGNRVREVEMNAYGRPMRDQWGPQPGPRN